MSGADIPSDFDARAYRSALGGFGTGVALVAARDAAGNAHGMIINSLTSVSLHPPIMLWCLAHSSAAFSVRCRSGRSGDRSCNSRNRWLSCRPRSSSP